MLSVETCMKLKLVESSGLFVGQQKPKPAQIGSRTLAFYFSKYQALNTILCNFFCQELKCRFLAVFSGCAN